MPRQVQVISHGPHCLDGLTAAVAVARYFDDRATVAASFASNSEIDATLRAFQPPAGPDQQLWITDISWREPSTDAHLRALAEQGLEIVWIDHHRTALQRFQAGEISVPFAHRILSEDYAASRLTYEYLLERTRTEGIEVPRLRQFAPVVAMADDNDRWLHQVPGSRELAWVVRGLGPDAFEDFLGLDAAVTYTPRMAAARERAADEIRHSLAIAEGSRVERPLGDATLVVAVCDGHPSEIADAWGKITRNTVFALYDAKSLSVSLRRSPDCAVDLSTLARALGGGGHAAAAGCELPDVRRALSELIAARVLARSS
jgi:uncharacterized protein